MFASAKSIIRNLVGAAGTIVFAGLCIAGATAPANAQIAYGVNDTGHRVAYVSYADLDLGSKAGRARLETRLRVASKNVCVNDIASAASPTLQNQCFRQALNAVRNVTMAAIAADKAAGKSAG